MQTYKYYYMKKLSKFDALLYVSQSNEPGKEGLLRLIRNNILFKDVSERVLSERIRELRKDGLIEKKALKTDTNNAKTWDCLALLYWAKMKGVNYNELLGGNVTRVFRAVFGSRSISMKKLMSKTGISKPTALKIIRVLERNNFIEIKKKKPLVLVSNLNDLTFFYANFLDFQFNAFEKRFTVPDIPKIRSGKLIEHLIRTHAYSTTVTEGNTATEEDVERVFDNYPVNLTPREVTEILNAREAVKYLYRTCEEGIDEARIRKMHETLMNTLLEYPGNFHYGRKRIVGSDFKLPDSKDEIDSSIRALLNFCRKHENNEDNIDPQVMGAIAHFIFVSIHPFIDGNGRVARLLHSWILLKAGLPLFVFDPNKRNVYFNALEKGRKGGIDKFVEFCMEEHHNLLKKNHLIRNKRRRTR